MRSKINCCFVNMPLWQSEKKRKFKENIIVAKPNAI